MGDPSAILLKIGMSESKIKETLKNEQLTKSLVSLISTAEKEGPVNQAIGNLLYHLASKTRPQIQERVPIVAKYIVKKEIESMVRLDAALEYLVATSHGDFSVSGLEKACGVGVVVTKEDVKKAVSELIDKKKSEIVEKRYKFNIGLLMQEVRSNLKWADGKDIKNEVDSQILSLLGPKTDEDKAPQKKEPKKPSNQTVVKQTKVEEVLTIEEMISKLHLHAPGDNYKTDGYVITQNTKTLLEAHLALSKGQVRTRFPPEPNGILHIGHAKAININFGYASHHKGVCFLRYDDTNPEKEEEKYFTGIKDMVEWLGYKPFKITHSSDYFDQLYEWAVKLIKAGFAYVCHQKQEEMQGFNPPPSPWRERPVEENLKLFEDMRKGKMDEGEATLRMKITLEEGKQDPVAYRIKYVAHHRTGNKWCIYPTYDYTHCLCDSIEHITHSLCTKEFQSRRSSYYWLCNALDIYCPVQWEYGRLNMNYTVVSKRKIAKLIEKKIVNDWDDPRLFTLSALRRRGFPPEAINRFCAKVGVTGAQSVVDPDMLEASVRDVLNVTAPRTMVVLEPLQVEIVEGIDKETLLEIPDFPACPDKSKRKAVITKTIFIETSDFKEEGEKGYKRWTKDQPVGLRYANYLLKYISEGSSSKYRTIKAKAEIITPENKPKAFIHWVSKPVPVEVRLYNNLFKHKNPEDPNEVPDGFLSDVTTDSLVVCEGLADASITKESRPFTQFQFERLGYFSIDPDTRPSKMVFNRTVLLKEDSGKS